jgi:hypothetical protein
VRCDIAGVDSFDLTECFVALPEHYVYEIGHTPSMCATQ